MRAHDEVEKRTVGTGSHCETSIDKCDPLAPCRATKIVPSTTDAKSQRPNIGWSIRRARCAINRATPLTNKIDVLIQRFLDGQHGGARWQPNATDSVRFRNHVSRDHPRKKHDLTKKKNNHSQDAAWDEIAALVVPECGNVCLRRRDHM